MGESLRPELHLFILWEKARRVESKVLEDLGREMEIVWKGEMSFAGDAAESFKAFYGRRKPVNGALKVRKCGGGKFLVVVVRDNDPHYGQRWARGDKYYLANEKMYDLKTRYREWAGRKHRVHGTTDCEEFARDVFLLTGHSAEEWEQGVPDGIRVNIPVRAQWRTDIDGAGADLGISSCKVLQENRYINDVFFEGRLKDRTVIAKCSSTCAWSIGNEYRVALRLHAVAPAVVPEPLAAWTSENGERAFVVFEKVSGPSLTELLAQGATEKQADGFAADILVLAGALKTTGILHRDLFTDNLLLGADGHLKAIDWQLAIDRNDYREDPWVVRHWKFHYVVFGVNRELGLGVWNDFHALGKILAQLPQTDAVKVAAVKLLDEESSMTYASPPDAITRLKLRLYALSLRLQMMARGRRHRKYAQLERRYRTITGKM